MLMIFRAFSERASLFIAIRSQLKWKLFSICPGMFLALSSFISMLGSWGGDVGEKEVEK